MLSRAFFSVIISPFWSYSVIFIAALFGLIKTLIYPHHSTPTLFHKHRLPPGPKPWPIIGNVPEIMLSSKSAPKWIHQLMKNMDTEIACIKLGNVHVVPVSNPTIACEFLKKQDDIFASRPISMASRLLSGNYSTTALVPYGEQWKKMKKIVVKELLSPAKHRWLHGKRMEEADNLVRYVYMSQNNNGGLVNVRIATQHYCGNVLRKIIFDKRYFGEGREDGEPGFEEIEHVDAIFIMLKHLYAFSVSDYVPFLRALDVDGHKKMLKNAMRTVNKYHDPIIEQRIQQWKEGTKTKTEDLLDVMISLKDAHNNPLLTMQEIKAQITELMNATVDNPSNAVEWALAEMMKQPEIFEKATEELDKVIGNERLVEESDIPKLNYIKACLRESFRLHPIGPFNIPHVAMRDTVVSNYFIPKGSHVLLSRVELGRNPKVWEEPLKFKPERHLRDDGSNVFLTEEDLRFITFTAGKRGCPGVVLGTTMSVMLLARLIHGFTWTAPTNQPVELLQSETGAFMAHQLVVVAKPRLPNEAYRLLD